MDTSHLEYTAEDLISHKLQRGGLLVAKPKFDRDGTDLIALMEVADGAKFCRIQCKGRTLTGNKSSNVVIPEEYVSGAFFVFLYVEIGESKPFIFCFSTKEMISRWKLNPDKKNNKKYYYLGFTKNTILNNKNKSNLQKFLFTDNSIGKIKEIIKRSVSKNEIELFDLIKKQQNLIKMKDEIYRLENWTNEYSNAEMLIVYKRKELAILKEKYRATLSKIGPVLSENLKEKIAHLLLKNISVDKIIKQVKNIIPVDISESILREYIINFMITY
jgi:hypothetical protein